jgi:hypothetical protein
MDSLPVGIQPLHRSRWRNWTQVNNYLRDHPFLPAAHLGVPGSSWNGGRLQIGMLAAIKSECLAAMRWNPQLGEVPPLILRLMT